MKNKIIVLTTCIVVGIFSFIAVTYSNLNAQISQCISCSNCNNNCKNCSCCVKKQNVIQELSSPSAAIQVSGPVYDTEVIQCDLPTTEHLQNKAGSNGYGLCVFTSLDIAAKWCNAKALIGFRDFMTQYPGGGWPGKVDEFIPKMAQSKGLPAPAYIQHEGGDIEFLKLALKTGRIVSVTYAGQDGVFYNQGIDHMVNLVHIGPKYAVILDNNNPGKYLWMSISDFETRWKARGGGWAVVLLPPGPPPIPKNWNRKVNSLNNFTIFGKDIEPFNIKEDKKPRFELPSKPLLGIAEDGEEVFRGPALKEMPMIINDGNYGITKSLIKTESSFSMNGKQISKEKALKVMGDQLVDDSKLYRLTINFEDENVRKRIEADINNHPSLAKWKSRFLLQSYEPTNWAVANIKHQPGVIFQTAPDEKGYGIVLFRMTQYTTPENLAEALRVADEEYRASADKDPSNKIPDLNSLDIVKTLQDLPSWIYILGGLGALIFFKKSKDNKQTELK